MNGLHKRLGRLEANAQQDNQTVEARRPRLVRALCRLFAQEVAAGTRRPEDATEAAVIAHLQRPRSKLVGGLAERLKAAKEHCKTLPEGLEVCHE